MPSTVDTPARPSTEERITILPPRGTWAIQGAVLFLSAVFVIVNLLADLAYAKTDPRVAYS